MINANQIDIEKWQKLLQTSKADAAAWVKYSQGNQERTVVCKEMVAFLKQYLDGQCDTETLRETFDHKTRNEWTCFGLKGLSGGMFLNMLVKHIPDTETLTSQLRAVLPVAKNPHDGRCRMQSFMDYLVGLIQMGTVSKAQVQPARLAYFISAWWHLQDTEQWPIYYISGRQALEREGLYSSTGAAVNDYFAFREPFLALAAALKLQSWDCEHLLDWHDKHPSGETGENDGDGGDSDDGENAEVINGGAGDNEKVESAKHAQMQWLLARIGKKLNCKVWIAPNDHNKEWNGQKLGDFSIKDLPMLGVEEDAQKIIRMIDVVWIKGAKQIVAAFEIEMTTSIFSGLLRMSDLVVSAPNLSFPLYLVAPEHRLSQVRTQLSRPTFQHLELHECCGFFSCEALITASEGIMKWANDPSVIETLATKVEGVNT